MARGDANLVWAEGFASPFRLQDIIKPPRGLGLGPAQHAAAPARALWAGSEPEPPPPPGRAVRGDDAVTQAPAHASRKRPAEAEQQSLAKAPRVPLGTVTASYNIVRNKAAGAARAPAKKRAARRPSAPPARPLPLADSARLLTRADGGPKRPGVPPAARGAPASTKRRAANGADVPAAKRARPPPAAGPAQHAAAPTALTRARCPPAADPPPLCEAGVAAEGAAFLAEVQAARGLRDGSAPAWRGGPGLAALPLPLDLGQHGFLAEEAREEDSVSLLEVDDADLDVFHFEF